MSCELGSLFICEQTPTEVARGVHKLCYPPLSQLPQLLLPLFRVGRRGGSASLGCTDGAVACPEVSCGDGGAAAAAGSGGGGGGLSSESAGGCGEPAVSNNKLVDKSSDREPQGWIQYWEQKESGGSTVGEGGRGDNTWVGTVH